MDSPQKTPRRNADQQLAIHPTVNFKAKPAAIDGPDVLCLKARHKAIDGTHWAIAPFPRPIGVQAIGHLLDDGVKYHTIAVRAYQRRVGIQLCENMLLCMVRVETNQYALLG